MSLLDLIKQYGDVSFEEGFAFGQEESELVKIYAHRRAQLFEKIQKMIQPQESRE